MVVTLEETKKFQALSLTFNFTIQKTTFMDRNNTNHTKVADSYSIFAVTPLPKAVATLEVP